MSLPTTSTPELSFRPIAVDTAENEPDDLETLYRIYASTRQDELAQVPWSEAEKETFLRGQFHAQHTHYMTHFPDAEYSMIIVDGKEAGRLYLDRRNDEFRLVDIALLPEHRGRGIGGRLMRGVLDEAAVAGKLVRIHVEQFNPALRLYDRLGFHKVEDQGPYFLMEWTPPRDRA